MDIKYLDSLWNSAFDGEPMNLYDDPMAAADYDNTICIREDGIKRAKEFNFPKEYKVLDIGAGPGILSIPLSKLVKEVVSVEPSIEMVKLLNKHIEEENINNIKIINKKWHEVEEFDSEFDAVIASYSLSMKDISKMILKMNKASKKHCYIFWFSGSPSWEDEQREIFTIMGKEYPTKLNKVNIIYEILYEMGLYPDIKSLRSAKIIRIHKTMEEALNYIKHMYAIKTNLYDDKIKEYIKKAYSKTEQGYGYKDTTNYAEVHWIKE